MKKLLVFIFSLITLSSSLMAEKLPKENRSLSGLRILQISILDLGLNGDTDPFQSVDLSQNLCPLENSDDIPEPFVDTLVKFDIINETLNIARFDTLRYVIKIGRKKYRSSPIYIAGTLETSSSSSSEIYSLFLTAKEGKKYLFNRRRLVLIDKESFKNVKFIIRGKFLNGKKFKIAGKTAISFTNLDRCE